VRFLAGEAGITQFLDLSQPAAVLLVAVLHFSRTSGPRYTGTPAW
jgi:hypothetical protein